MRPACICLAKAAVSGRASAYHLRPPRLPDRSRAAFSLATSDVFSNWAIAPSYSLTFSGRVTRRHYRDSGTGSNRTVPLATDSPGHSEDNTPKADNGMSALCLSGHQSDASRRSCNANSVFIGKLKDPAASLSRYPHCRSHR